VVSAHASTSQADGSDSDSSIFSFFITARTVGYSDNSEWILYIGATYHVCPNMDCFSNFEKLNGCFIVTGDDHPCNVEGISTVRVKMFDGIVRELKNVRYVPQLKINLISVGPLKTLGLFISIRYVILKITKGSMVVMRGVCRNNLYYLKDSTITGQVETSITSDDVCTLV